MESKNCLVCHEPRPLEGRPATLMQPMTMSEKPVLDILTSVLLLDLKVVDVATDEICRVCFELLDQVDAFEFSLEQIKAKIKLKHQQDFKDDDTVNIPESIEILPTVSDDEAEALPSNESRTKKKMVFGETTPNVLIDRLLVKSKWQANNLSPEESQARSQHKEKLLELQQRFEEDLKYVFQETPDRITNTSESEAWTLAILKAQMDPLELEIPGELDCFDCNPRQTFDCVMSRILHVLDNHSSSEESLYECSNCQSKFQDEQRALDHANFCSSLSRAKMITKDQDVLLCCHVVFKTNLAFWTHKYLRHRVEEEDAIQCSVCDKTLDSYSQYRRHFLIRHCDYALQCCHCPVVFDNDCQDCDQKLIQHIREQHCLSKSKPAHPCKSKSSTNPRKTYLSKMHLRSLRSEPLSNVEHFKANLNMSLYPPQDPTKTNLFDGIDQDLREDCLTTLELIRTMPHVITNADDQCQWDMAMLRSEVSNLSFGIPGESKCFDCQATFNTILERIFHCFNVHFGGSFNCINCNKIFSDMTNLRKHIVRKHGKSLDEKLDAKPFEIPAQNDNDEDWLHCRRCPTTCRSEYGYWLHMYLDHKRPPWALSCSVCGRSENSPMELKRHILMHHGGYTYVCMFCSKRYSTKDSIAAHLRTHLNSTKTTIKKVSNSDSEKTLHECHECGWLSKSQLLHDKHLLTSHGLQVAQNCNVCNEVLEDPKALLEHRKSIHSNDICYICAKAFLNLADLQNHIARLHPEMANIVEDAEVTAVKIKRNPKKEKTMCEVCSKMVLSHNIRLHMKAHEAKQLACPKCPRMFRWSSSLTSHISSAHGDTVRMVSIACEFCGKQFRDKSNLKQHRYSHTGGPHSCKSCRRGFGRKDLLLNHESKCQSNA